MITERTTDSKKGRTKRNPEKQRNVNPETSFWVEVSGLDWLTGLLARR